MVNYPTILGLPQEDIDRQLYVGVLGLESRVKALENKPKPILEITVTDGTNPVSGATVTIGTDEETSDSDGVVEFELAYGDYSATIEASGYTTATESLAFRSNHKNFTVTLTAGGSTGTVTVTCKDESENLLAGAEVFLRRQNALSNRYACGTTDSNGVTTLTLWDSETHQPTQDTSIAFGTYVLNAMYLDAQQDSYVYQNNLTVDGDENVIATLTLDE